MQITVNGRQQNYGGPSTILGLLQSLGVKPAAVVVERNLRIVPRSDLEKEPLEEGDRIEIIRFVGGG